MTAPLVGIMYLLDHWAGLPFVPFALFDWVARVLLGPLVTIGIDLMIDGIRFAGLSVADIAKTAEQIMAILIFFFIGVITVAVFFVIVKSLNIAPKLIFGLFAGALIGLPIFPRADIPSRSGAPKPTARRRSKRSGAIVLVARRASTVEEQPSRSVLRVNIGRQRLPGDILRGR